MSGKQTEHCDQRPPAIVIGLDSVVGLQAARILAARQVRVIGIGDGPHPFCRTRVCERVLFGDTKTGQLIDLLVRLGPGLQGAVLVPCADEPVLLIARHREELKPWYRMALPDEDTVALLLDKHRFGAFCRENGFPVPLTLTVESRADAERAAEQLRFPCVLKPSAKSRSWRRQFRDKAFAISSPQELLAVFDRVSRSMGKEKLIVQEWIDGGEDSLFSFNCYFDAASVPLTPFVARKLRQWPPETGMSSLGEECRNDEVLTQGIRLFQAARFRGLAYLEMKRDRRTGKHLLIEANVGRPTGRSPIAEAGAVELLYTMYCDTAGLPLPENREQRYSGVKWVYLRSDVQAALRLWLRGELGLGGWLASLRGPKAYAVFSWSDPVPFWLDLLGLVRDALGIRGRAFLRRLSAGSPDRERDGAP